MFPINGGEISKMNVTAALVAEVYPDMVKEGHTEIARVADRYRRKYTKSVDASIVAAVNYFEILDMLIDGVWIGLDIMGPIHWSYTTKQAHTVKLILEAI